MPSVGSGRYSPGPGTVKLLEEGVYQEIRPPVANCSLIRPDFFTIDSKNRSYSCNNAALYYKSGRDRLLTIVLVRDPEGKRPDQMFYCTKLDWTAKEILSAYACRWAIECTFEYCKQFLGLEDPANRLPKAVERTAPMALFLFSMVVVWFHQTGHQFVRFPFRPWYPQKEEPSFADMVTTLRRLSYDEKTEGLLPGPSRLKTWIAQLTELLSRTG